MNEFDQFMKTVLKVKQYARYTDDFVVVSHERSYLESLLPLIHAFLKDKLALDLHPKKVEIRKFHHGVDFLGYVAFPYHRLVRTKTRRRIFANLNQRITQYRAGIISKTALEQSLQSYLGVLSHADSFRLQEKLLNQFWFLSDA